STASSHACFFPVALIFPATHLSLAGVKVPRTLERKSSTSVSRDASSPSQVVFSLLNAAAKAAEQVGKSGAPFATPRSSHDAFFAASFSLAAWHFCSGVGLAATSTAPARMHPATTVARAVFDVVTYRSPPPAVRDLQNSY